MGSQELLGDDLIERPGTFSLRGEGDSEVGVAHAPPTMVFFFLFLFMLLLAAALLTVYVALCKPGCAVSAADTTSV